MDSEAVDRIFAEFRRIMLCCPDTWKRGSMSDEMVAHVWETQLDPSEKQWIVKHYGRWEHALDPPMAVVRWRAAVRPHVQRAREKR